MSTANGFACLLILALAGCGYGDSPKDIVSTQVSPEELQAFIHQVKGNLVFVEGGEFLMGDYGEEYGPEKAPYDSEMDSKPVHTVELSSFSMGKFKVTNQEYQFYLKDSNMKLRVDGKPDNDEWLEVSASPDTPAHMDWFEAEKYCNWLGRISDVPFALPTEAQWEYAARSRGKFLMVATNDGTYKAESLSKVTADDGPRGINISTEWDREAFANKMGWRTGTLTPLPVDMFPPNPLGLYSMSDNGLEWVGDWYDPDYYKISPLKDPRGPDRPTHKNYFEYYTKVSRGKDFADPFWGGGVNVIRTSAEPHGYIDESKLISLGGKTARCVVNSPAPVK